MKLNTKMDDILLKLLKSTNVYDFSSLTRTKFQVPIEMLLRTKNTTLDN